MLADDVVKDDAPTAIRDRIQLPSGRIIYWLMGLLVVYVIIRGVVAAAMKPFWFDELLTLTISSLPSMKTVWGALVRALDGQPPGFYAVERNVVGLLQSKHIALRLASILTFPCVLLCVFAYAKKRSGEFIGFFCALFLLLTTLFDRYAVEARPYSMLIACFAFALVCYQRIPSPFWTAMLALTLAVAQTLHHYAVLAMVPFGLAEAVFFLRTQKFRWQVWLAFVLGAMPLAFFWPLLVSMRSHFGAHYYENYGYSSIPGTYGAFFLTDSAFATAMVAVSIAGVVGSLFLPRVGAASLSKINDADVAEGTLLLSFVLLPFIAFTIIRVMHGGMRERYVLASILGISLALAATLSLARPRVVALFALFIVCGVAVREFRFWRSNHSLYLVSPAAGVEEFVQKNGHSDLPVVVASGMKYIPLAYYAAPIFSRRLFYLTDEIKALRYQGADTLDKNVLILRDYMPLQVRDFSEFTSSYSEFLVYAEEPDDAGTWLPMYLSREAATMRTVAVEPVRRLYLVTMKDNSSH